MEDEIEKCIEQQNTVRNYYINYGISTTLRGQDYEAICNGKDKFEDILFPHNNSSIYNYSEMEISLLKKSKTEKIENVSKIYTKIYCNNL